MDKVFSPKTAMPNPDSGSVWGVLGGSFDPVHNGHIYLAENICKSKQLAGVLFVPAFNHPFKKDRAKASYVDRAAMLKLALKNNLQLCEIEKEESLSGYTIDTLRALKMRFPKATFHFIIGLDLVNQLKNWHKSDELMKETQFLAGSRPGQTLEAENDMLINNVEIVKINEIDISASAIRHQIRTGATRDDIRQLVPHEVAEYIFDKGLYR